MTNKYKRLFYIKMSQLKTFLKLIKDPALGYFTVEKLVNCKDSTALVVISSPSRLMLKQI